MLLHHVEKLSHYAADRPDINRRPIVLVEENDLRGPIPSADDMLGQDLVALRLLPTSVARCGVGLGVDHAPVEILSLAFFFLINNLRMLRAVIYLGVECSVSIQ